LHVASSIPLAAAQTLENAKSKTSHPDDGGRRTPMMAHDDEDDAAASCRLCCRPPVAGDQRHPICAAANAEDGCGGTRPGGGLRDTIVKHLRIQVSDRVRARLSGRTHSAIIIIIIIIRYRRH